MIEPILIDWIRNRNKGCLSQMYPVA